VVLIDGGTKSTIKPHTFVGMAATMGQGVGEYGQE